MINNHYYVIEDFPNQDNPDEMHAEDLSFEQLQKALELAPTSYREIENGFECVNGKMLTTRKNNHEVYKLALFPGHEGQSGQAIHRA